MNELITECLKRREISFLYGVKEEWLGTLENKWLDFIYTYSTKYGEPPLLTRFEKEFPNFVAVFNPDPLLDVYEQTLKEVRNEFAKSYLMKKQDALKAGEDPTEMVRELWTILSGGESGSAHISTFDKSLYIRGAKSFKTTMHSLNVLAGGLVAGDLFLIAGRPGDGKTTLLASQVIHWYLDGKRILLISNEIKYDDMLWKIDCMLTGINPAEKRAGMLFQESQRKLLFLKQVQARLDGEIVVPQRPVRTPAEVQGLIEMHKPDIVCIDGLYLMSPDGKATAEWEKMATVSREIKQIAVTQEVLIVGVVQMNREAERSGASKSTVAGTDAYVQDSDLLVAVHAEEYVGDIRKVAMTVIKNRHGGYGVVNILYNYATFKVEEGL